MRGMETYERITKVQYKTSIPANIDPKRLSVILRASKLLTLPLTKSGSTCWQDIPFAISSGIIVYSHSHVAIPAGGD